MLYFFNTVHFLLNSFKQSNRAFNAFQFYFNPFCLYILYHSNEYLIHISKASKIIDMKRDNNYFSRNIKYSICVYNLSFSLFLSLNTVGKQTNNKKIPYIEFSIKSPNLFTKNLHKIVTSTKYTKYPKCPKSDKTSKKPNALSGFRSIETLSQSIFFQSFPFVFRCKRFRYSRRGFMLEQCNDINAKSCLHVCKILFYWTIFNEEFLLRLT